MVNSKHNKPSSYLTILSIGISGFLLCLGVGTLKSHHYKVEYQQFQLEVGTALYKVKKVSDTLERTAETSAIAPQDKRKLQRLTEQSAAVLKQVEADIQDEADQLNFLEE